MTHHLSTTLKAMGNTSEEVAATLQKAGCRGKRWQPHACPVARYLMNELEVIAQVTQTHINLGIVGLHAYQVGTPRPVADFLSLDLTTANGRNWNSQRRASD